MSATYWTDQEWAEEVAFCEALILQGFAEEETSTGERVRTVSEENIPSYLECKIAQASREYREEGQDPGRLALHAAFTSALDLWDGGNREAAAGALETARNRLIGRIAQQEQRATIRRTK